MFGAKQMVRDVCGKTGHNWEFVGVQHAIAPCHEIGMAVDHSQFKVVFVCGICGERTEEYAIHMSVKQLQAMWSAMRFRQSDVMRLIQEEQERQDAIREPDDERQKSCH